MNIRYRKTMGIIYILVGILFACMYFVIALGGGKASVTPLVFAFLAILFGILFLTRTYFVLNEDGLVLYAILGPAKTVYKIQSLKDIEIENKTVYVTQEGKRTKIPIAVWMVEKKDWQAFVQKVNEAKQSQ